MERWKAFCDEWKQEPPIAPWVTSFLGFKPQERSANAWEMFALFPGGNISMEGLAPVIQH